MNILVAGESLELLAERAVFWEAKKSLLLSDIHIGKPESLQAVGIPVPSGAHLDDLSRIDQLLQRTHAEEVYILGDMIHNRHSWSDDIQNDLKQFFTEHDHVHWTLLLGNHEKGSRQYLEKLPIDLIETDLVLGPFLLSHGHDSTVEDHQQFIIQGHVHPVVRLNLGAIRLRLPCFVLNMERLTLPSFGMLTGGYEISKSRGRRIFATTPESVFEIPSNETLRTGAKK
ncbi:MAG: ligase-associated DNA damage response endonuclease PdeM [Bdellovibrionaceae bacterium]|nr:ligase-associated DNA damage response endonuclease PdeM [Pseudobdellovibrionaceae bacterium]